MSVTLRTLPTIIKDNYRVSRATRASLRVGSSMPKSDQRMRHEFRIQAERIHHDLRTEEGRTHPAGVDAVRVSSQQHVLDARTEALNGHRPFSSSALRIGVAIQVLGVE